MYKGRFVFSQILDYLPRYEFDKLVSKYKGDWHAKELTCYNQLLHLLFGQLTGCDSLRDICLCLGAHGNLLYHLGFSNTVNPSSLSRANDKRDSRIYEELGALLIDDVRPLYSEEEVAKISIDNVLYALDSTTISTSIKLASWALGKYSRGAVKMHTLLALRGCIPTSIHITDGKWHDSNELDHIDPEPLAFYMMDKAYVDLEALYRFHRAGAYWISRPKDNMRYEVTSHRADFTIRLTTPKSRKLYPESLRMVVYYDMETGNEVTFITNNFEISALEIANLYRHRWDIEVFFKWIKQNIVVKTFWGYSENAVKTHLWVAIIAYLLLAKAKAVCDSTYSITEVATLIRISALERIPLRELVTKPDPSVIPNQSVKEPTLFDNL